MKNTLTQNEYKFFLVIQDHHGNKLKMSKTIERPFTQFEDFLKSLAIPLSRFGFMNDRKCLYKLYIKSLEITKAFNYYNSLRDEYLEAMEDLNKYKKRVISFS